MNLIGHRSRGRGRRRIFRRDACRSRKVATHVPLQIEKSQGNIGINMQQLQ